MVADTVPLTPAVPGGARLRFVELTSGLAVELEAAAADPLVASNYDLRGAVRAGQRLFAPGDDVGAYLGRAGRMSRAALLPEEAHGPVAGDGDRHCTRLVGAYTLHRGELSYFVLRRHWGRGHGRQIARAACQVAFDELGLAALDATVVGANVASRRIIEALGFRVAGHAHMVAARRGRVAVIRYTLTRQLSALTAS